MGHKRRSVEMHIFFSALLASCKVTWRVLGGANLGSLMPLIFFTALQTAPHNFALVLLSLLSKLRCFDSENYWFLVLGLFHLKHYV